MKNLEEFHSYVLAQYPMEACGYIMDDVFYPVKNIHSDPLNNFLFPEEVSFSLLKKDYSIVHSHTFETFTHDPRTPSKEDMEAQQLNGQPWGIVHCDGKNVSEILYFGRISTLPLEGRPYIPNVYDCFTLARDYIFQETQIDIGSHPRPADWESWNPDYIEQTYRTLSFSDTTSIRKGDILLFVINSRKPNHIGVYLGEDVFIHHLYGRTSARDSFQKWKRLCVKALRFNHD